MRTLFYLFTFSVILFSCQKELSIEGGTPVTPPAAFTLTGSPNACTGATVNGAYFTGLPLDVSNTVTVSVNVTTIGAYSVSTATINGYKFSISGTFTTTGTQTITLVGSGTPVATQADSFIPTASGITGCSFSVTVSTPVPAVYSFSGTPGACTVATVAGTYVNGTALTASNTVTVQVNVTTAGAYTISTNAVGGMTFSKSGFFATTGLQTVVLAGAGTPTTAGANNFTVGTNGCTFSVTVIGQAAFTMNCAGATVNGTYTAGTALTASNTITLPVNVASAGGYSITGTAGGMTFTATGTFSTTGNQNVTLNGSNTPSGSGGAVSLPLTGGTANCSVTINVSGGGGGGGGGTFDWKFTEGSTTFQGTTSSATLQSQSAGPVTFTVFSFDGDNPAGDNISITLTDISGGIKANETYSTSATSSNSSIFDFSDGTGAVTYEGIPMLTTGTTLTIKVTSHNTGTKTIVGTFSGTVKNGAGATKTISNGTFQGTYQ